MSASHIVEQQLLLAGDMERAMMKVHAKPPRPKPAAAAVPDGEAAR